jgi:hypothetical protein
MGKTLNFYPSSVHGSRAWAIRQRQDGSTPPCPDPSFSLQHDPIVTKLPVFLRAAGPNNQELHSSNPIYSSDLNVPLKAACREVALRCQVRIDVWRRGILNAIARNASNDVARQHADHTYDE